MMVDTRVDAATAAELERLELMLMDPVVRRDREQVSLLLAQDFVEFGSSGRVWTRQPTLELLATETYTPPVVEDFACRMLGASVALVTYRAVRTNDLSGERVATLRSSLWTRESGIWQMRFHQGTRSI